MGVVLSECSVDLLSLYLSPPKGTKPPSLDAGGVLLEDSEEVTTAKGEFVGRLGDVVVQRLGHALLQQTPTHCHMSTL